MKRWTKSLYAVYVLLLIASTYVIVDALLPTQIVSSQVEATSELEVNTSGRRNRAQTHWTLVTLRNGIRFQTENRARDFPNGDTVDVEVTSFRNEVLSFKLRKAIGQYWRQVEGANKEYLAFPASICLCSLLLLLPFWSEEKRMLLTAILGVMLVAWTLTLIGTGGMKSFN